MANEAACRKSATAIEDDITACSAMKKDIEDMKEEAMKEFKEEMAVCKGHTESARRSAARVEDRNYKDKQPECI